ncbi:MAG: ACP phosphodiesterase [Parahaliea sp.]
MNFLAHFHLAWPDRGLVIGALEGDYCKGYLKGDFKPDIEAGIALHRAIDAFTDEHPLLLQLRQAFPASIRRYAGILTDLSFDYYLSHHWAQFSTLALADFNREVYRVLQASRQKLSHDSLRMLTRLIKYDLLNRYQYWDTIITSARYIIGQRLRQEQAVIMLEEQLQVLRTDIERTFLQFYPLLADFVYQRTGQSSINNG